jgi:hypothetical protein
MRTAAIEETKFSPVSKPAAAPNISNLSACIADVVQAAADGDSGPPNITDFATLRGRLEGARQNIPPLYQNAIADPYIATLDAMGASDFAQIITQDPTLEGLAGLMFDISQAILQHGDNYLDAATGAYQEVVSDLFDGFLSAEDRRGVKPPDREVIAPLAKWGNPDFGPYTWPIDATEAFHCSAAVVNLPPGQARAGLVGWSALGHEVGGHDILHADDGLMAEIIDDVFTSVLQDTGDDQLASYFSERMDETGSDVLGILNMGPAAAIGLIVYFRGLNQWFAGTPTLRADGPGGDPHPADISRGFLGAEVVKLLKFKGAKAWAEVITSETERDIPASGRITLDGNAYDPADVKKAVAAVARTMVQKRFVALDNQAFGKIQNWKDQDEAIVSKIRTFLAQSGSGTLSINNGFYAAHVVAAGTMAALAGQGDLGLIQSRMITLLKRMHTGNASWGPLNVRHPGDIVRDRTYQPTSDGMLA